MTSWSRHGTALLEQSRLPWARRFEKDYSLRERSRRHRIEASGEELMASVRLLEIKLAPESLIEELRS